MDQEWQADMIVGIDFGMSMSTSEDKLRLGHMLTTIEQFQPAQV